MQLHQLAFKLLKTDLKLLLLTFSYGNEAAAAAKYYDAELWTACSRSRPNRVSISRSFTAVAESAGAAEDYKAAAAVPSACAAVPSAFAAATADFVAKTAG